ncbi:hypothetical protein L6452_38961 [Arctium lappa]|uniref:Uncharacterized protein n=1 Tax=Arctium lappa TaxID=4217 RepID=A0ACB8XQZ8_ARCLA|nr:hypothetical protein L6452_38961 [Arctium lappa]
MSTKNDEGVAINWTDESIAIFCDVYINFITKNGLEERWDHLFGDAVATGGESCVAPSSTPEFVDQSASQSVSQVEEIQNKEGGTEDAYNNDCSQHSNRLENLDVQEDGFWQDFLEDVRGTNTKKDEVSIDEIMDIMNRISANSDFEVGGDTWCHAMLMFRDPTSREIFFKMPSDDARNDAEDMVFNVVQQHGDYIPMEELDGETSSNQGNMRGSSNEMREIRNNIANMIWNANNVF